MSDRIDVIVTPTQWDGGDWRAPLLNITDLISEPLTFSSTAQGGFSTASIAITCDEHLAAQFLETYFAKRVVMVNPLCHKGSREARGQGICWEGRIFTVTIDDGKYSVSRSLQDIYNAVIVEYTEAVVIGSTYYEGETTYTTAVSTSASDTLYGTRELIYTAGVLTTAAADDYAARLAADYATPRAKVSNTSIGGGGDGIVAVRLDCAGWFETYQSRFYTTGLTSTYSTHILIENVITDLNDFTSTSDDNIDAVGAPGYIETQLEFIPASEYINRLTAAGSNANRRCYFGFYEEGTAYFYEEPTTARYRISRMDQSERVYDSTLGRFVPPWDIRPGYWCEVVDFLPTASQTYSSIRDNPRAFVIGTVDFTAPHSVTLTPLDSDSASLTLSRMDWYSQMLPFFLRRLDEAPTPYEPPPPDPGSPPPWIDPDQPIPLDPWRRPKGWEPPYAGGPDPRDILPPLPGPPSPGGPIPDP